MFNLNSPGFLTAFPERDDVIFFSDSRNFAHEEEDYDKQYAIDPSNMLVGRGLVNILRRSGADFQGPALEIGCGTGILSLGLVAEAAYPLTVVTDPSPAFIRITRKKVERSSPGRPGVRYAILRAEDLDRMPANTFSLIVLRSTLHHVLDIDKFMSDAARALKQGGVLTFQEPCMEGYVLMGAMAQFFPVVMAANGRKLTPPQLAQVANFVGAMKFYARRDVDKSTAEDKHLFRVDELQRMGAALGMSFEFWSNRPYEHFANLDSQPPPDNFADFFYNYLKYCMSFSEDVLKLFRANFTQYCKFVMDYSANGNGPHLHGVFTFTKR